MGYSYLFRLLMELTTDWLFGTEGGAI